MALGDGPSRKLSPIGPSPATVLEAEKRQERKDIMDNAKIVQFARILGQGDFFSCLSLAEPQDLDTLTPDQLARVQELASRNVAKIARTLVHEAMANDSVNTAAEADTYLQSRLDFFGELLSADARRQVADLYRTITGNWG
jgi:hypothetical protein